MKGTQSTLESLQKEKLEAQRQLLDLQQQIEIIVQERDHLQNTQQRLISEVNQESQTENDKVAQLQDDLIISQTKLEAVKDECDKSNTQLVEKVSEVNKMLQEISSLQEQIPELHQKVEEESIKNWGLCEQVSLLEKEITVLRLIQSEPAEDELAASAESLERLNGEWKLISRNAAVNEEHYSLVHDYECELCAVQKKNELHLQSLKRHGTKWSEGAAEELKFCELECMNRLIYKKLETMRHVKESFSEIQDIVNSMESDLKEEVKCQKEFVVWLEDFKGLHLDTTKLNDRMLQENRRLCDVTRHLAKKMKTIALCKIKQDTMKYRKSLETDLQERKEQSKELQPSIHQIAAPVDSNILEENLRLHKMQCRIQDLETELSAAKADAKQKGQKALMLEDKLCSNTAQAELSEMQVKMNEKDKRSQAAVKEMQVLQVKVSEGAAPYTDEIDSLKNQVVRLEMDRIKLSKAAEQQIASLKGCIEEKEECLRKLKEQLRRTQKDVDTTICASSSSSTQYPLTCGGGSGIVQSTAMLMLQSENAGLKREIGQYKKRCHQLSRNLSSCEEECKKMKDRSSRTPTTPIHLSSEHRGEATSCKETDLNQAPPVSQSTSEMPTSSVTSPGKTWMHRKCVLSPKKTEKCKPQPMSPNKRERHSVLVMSPGNTGLSKDGSVSPYKTEGPLFGTLTASPCKKQKLLIKTDAPKDKFFDARSKSLPYCPSKFFDNSTLGTLPDLGALSSDNNPSEESDTELCTGSAERKEDNWWESARKTETPDDCKTS